MSKWNHVRLGDHCNLLTGFPFKSAEYVEDKSAVKLVRGDNVVQGKMRWNGVKRWATTGLSEQPEYVLKSDDVVLAMDRPWIEAGLKYARILEAD